MKKSRWNPFVIIISWLMLASGPSIGQELPNLNKVAIKSNVSLAGSVYSYTYVVTNDVSNVGDIYILTIDIARPANSLNLNMDGLTNGPNFSRNSSDLVLQEKGASMIPIGLSSPPHWSVGLSIDETAQWGGSDKSLFIPGQELSGFAMTSQGLPGIRVFKVEPFVDIDTLPDNVLPPDDVDAAKQFTENLAFFGKTIGPTAPPANFVALDFLNSIIDLKHQAGALGWITNPGVQDSLDVKLDQVAKKLQAGDTKTAANLLNAFLNEVDAQGCPKYDGCPAGKHLLPEAWALLKFNAQYLLAKL